MKYLLLIALLFSGSLCAEVAPEPLRLTAMPDYDEQQKVVMYATSWCPYCQQARNYFRQQGIPYTEYDIERDAEAKRRYQAFGGRGIPVIFVGKRRMNGFSASGFNRIYR
jgi:glutaredoxin